MKCLNIFANKQRISILRTLHPHQQKYRTNETFIFYSDFHVELNVERMAFEN